MTETNDFLAGLKRLARHAATTPKTEVKDVLLMIKTDGPDNQATLTPVDRHLYPIDADDRHCPPAVAAVLRTMDRIRQQDVFKVEWGTASTDGLQVTLADHPQLIFQLLRCDNLVDAQGKPITVCADTARLTLRIDAQQPAGRKAAEKPVTLVPRLVLETAGDSPAAAADSPVTLLSDGFALCGGRLCPIVPVGDNYNQLHVFLTPFDDTMLETYLSVFFSFVDNVTVSYADYDISFDNNAITPQPAILFEKVDEDRTLFLRLVEQVKTLPVDFMRQFDLSMVATVNAADRRISVRPISRLDLDAAARDLHRQINACAPSRTAAKQVYADGDVFVIPEETASPFLLTALPTLLRSYVLLGADKLLGYKLRPVQPRLKVNLSSGIDFLEGDAAVVVGDDSFTLRDLLAQYSKQKYVQLSSGERAIIDEGYMRRLERIFSRQKDKDGRVRVSFFDLPEIEALVNEPLEGEAFRHHREVYEGFNNLHAQTLRVPSLKATLRPYQQEGIKWMRYLYDNNLGGCLADDMGLGKTVQTIGLLATIYPKTKRPTLIVMPRSLLFNWQNELQRFAPHLTVYTYYATGRDFKEALNHQVVLTTYAVVRNDIDTLRKKLFHCVILDESQNIKNLASQTTQAVFLLRADHRLALSGTPIENNLSELYSLFRFLNPTMFGTPDDFNSRYALPIQRDNDKEALEALRRRIFPFMLRRLKRDVLTDLPDRIEQTLYVEMTPQQAELYERRRLYYSALVKQTIATDGVQKSQFVMFQAMSELRRIASVPESLSDGAIDSPKLEQLVDAVVEAAENGHKVVVFFNFIAGLEITGDRLEAAGIDYCSMTGSTTDRRSIVDRFQNDRHCRVMLMTLKTGGVGLNLTAADTVFIFEPWWNKAAEEQAINRLHRYGQKATVLSYSLITRHSIEEKIQQLQQQKADLFDGLISADASSSKKLSEEDINFILG